MFVRVASILGLVGVSASVFAQALPVTFVAPTLDEFGLLGLGAMVGVAGLISLIRRKK